MNQLLSSNDKAFVINYTNDEQTTIAYAVFKSKDCLFRTSQKNLFSRKNITADANHRINLCESLLISRGFIRSHFLCF